MSMHAIRDCAPAHNNNFSSEERDLRTEVGADPGQAHNSGALCPAVYAVTARGEASGPLSAALDRLRAMEAER